MKYQMDLLTTVGGDYLYLDWGKRFCIAGWKSVKMFAFYPGNSVEMSALDPGLLITDTTLGNHGWFEASLIMKIGEKLPKNNYECDQQEHGGEMKKLRKIHTDHEQCIVDKFMENWSQRNRSCSPFIMENFVQK